MKPRKPLLVTLCASVLLVAFLAGCPNPITPAKDSALVISITNNINARTLLPPIDMNAASFSVSGTGPGGATFSQSSTGGPVTANGLAFGTWSVTVNALNAWGTIIGSGQATVTVHTGQTATVAITVVPLEGNGTLNLTVTWTGSQVDSASILATLTPPIGSATPLSFSVSDNEGTYSSTTIPAGYQTLTLQLLDNSIPVMGAVEVVRVVAGHTTTGTYAFTNVNQPGGSVQVNITPAMADPIPVSISGVPSTVTAGAGMTATASVSDGTSNVDYVWYLNGVSVGMGPSYALGSTVTAGYYRLDVTAYAAGGTRAGSATASFQVTAAGPQSGIITTVAGNGYRAGSEAGGGYSGDGGPAVSTMLNFPSSVAFDSSNNLYIVDSANNRIRKVTLDGIIVTIAGTGAATYSGDGGQAISASLSSPWGLAFDSFGNLYILEAGGCRVRKIDSAGTITTVAGNGTPGYSGDGGPATSAELKSPLGIAVDSSGNIYIADTYNYTVRMVSPLGVISTVAGNGTGGYSGDGGTALVAQLNLPSGVAVDGSGNLFIADRMNGRIRKVNQSGTISTAAGHGISSDWGDGGPATAARFVDPVGVNFDLSGNLYIAELMGSRIRKVTPAGTITTFAGQRLDRLLRRRWTSDLRSAVVSDGSCL